MKLKQPLVFVLAALSLLLFFAGCNDTFRPVVTPIPQPGGVPSQQKFVFVLSSTGTGATNPGALSALDVSGDTDVGEIVVGNGATSMALGANGSIVYVANQADSSISAISGFVPNTTTPLTLTQSVTALPAGLLCPSGSCSSLNPMIVSGNNLYIAQAPPQSGSTGQGTVLVTAAVSNLNLTGQISIGATGSISVPSLLLSSSPVGKVYSLNTNTNDLTSWSNQSNLVSAPSILVGKNPIKAVINGQGNRIFTLNATDATVSVIDTVTDKVIDTGTDANPSPTGPMPVGSQPTAMFLDNNNNRLFVANSGASSNSISIINVAVPQPTSSPTPNPLINPNPNFGQTTTINIPASFIPPTPVPTPTAPVATPTPIAVSVQKVVATPDGKRAYVLSVDPVGGNACVFLVSLLDNQVVQTPVFSVHHFSARPASYLFDISSDGTKVYVVLQNASQTLGGITGRFNIFSLSTNSTITTVNNVITSVNNTFASINLPQQPIFPVPISTPTPGVTPTPLPAIPIEISPQQ